MPPVMSIDGVQYQLRLKWRLHGQQCFNVLHFISRGSQDLVENLLVPVLACVTDNLLPILSNEVTLDGADVKNVSGSTAQEAEQVLTSANVGGVSGNSLPSTCSATVALKTAHAGRSGKGRMSLLGIPEANQANSVVDATFLAAAVAFLACMAAAFINGDPPATPFFDWAVRSKKDNTSYPIQSTAVRQVIGSQRSRKLGIGI